MSHSNINSQLGSNPYGLESLQNYYDFETGENIEEGLNCGVINANICAFRFFEIDISSVQKGNWRQKTRTQQELNKKLIKKYTTSMGVHRNENLILLKFFWIELSMGVRRKL